MVTKLILDVETYSSVDLKSSGVYAYVESEDHEVLMCAYSEDFGGVEVAIGEDQIRQAIGPALSDPSVLKIAHNAGFDRVNLSKVVGMPTGEYLDPAQWEDTMAIALENALPASLDKLSKTLGVSEKDSAGTLLINYFSKPGRDGKKRPPESAPEKWEDFVRYCVQDVQTLVEVYQVLPNWTSPQEKDYWCIDQEINDRGILVDLELSALAIEADRVNQELGQARLREILGVENANSVKQLQEGYKNIGLDLPNLRATTIEETLGNTDLTPMQRESLELRADLSLSASKKFSAIQAGVSDDGRLRGQFKFFGAHTGRWSGRGVQLQNLPRAEVKYPEAALLDLQAGLGASPKTLKSLVRHSLLGPFVVSDYSAIEARVLAWLAGESWAVEAFKEGRDIYLETAKRMGGLSRQQGKVAVLALGYQGGVNSLRHMGAKGDDAELESLKTQWRKTNKNIVRMWREFEELFMTGGVYRDVRVRVMGKDRHVILPSGRHMVYRNVRQESWRIETEDGIVRKNGIRFNNSLHRTDTYGGRLVENMVQAVSRDVLADLMLRLQSAGYRVVGHVHDEVIVDVSGVSDKEAALEKIVAMMSKAPVWADGLPLNAEGFITDRYKKG